MISQRTNILALLTAALLAIFGVQVCADESQIDAKHSAETVRAAYQTVSSDVLGIKEPVIITSHSSNKKPKSIGLTLSADGTTHFFSWFLDKGFSNVEHDRIYWSHWKGVGRVKQGPLCLEYQGPKEAALYGLLLRWAKSKEAEATLDIVEEKQLEFISSWLVRLDRRFAGEEVPKSTKHP